MAITVSDTFTRADTAVGTLGSTETGATLAWQNASNWQINSNTALNNGTTESPSWISNGQPNANILMSTNNQNGAGIAFWVKDSTNFWMAWLRSNRYLASQTTNCNSCTDCSFGGCNVANISGCSKSTSTAVEQNYSGCGSCSSGSCSAASYTCAELGGNGTHLLYTYASCGSSCTSVTSGISMNCSGSGNKVSCGSTNSGSTSCSTSCSGSSTSRKCGSATCSYSSTTCGGSCGSTGRSNRNCSAVCSGCTTNYNAAASGTSCNICGSTTTNNYGYEYYLRVDRIVGGSATNVTNLFYADLGSSSGYFSNMRVITSSATFRVLGYTDGTGTTSVSDTGVTASGVSDWQSAVGHGIIIGTLGSASPGAGNTVDNFSLTYDPLGGDSVGIIQG